MRLWHQTLLPYLDSKRLLSQHRECCALRGKGWGRKHATIDYVFKYDLAHLFNYHMRVIYEMHERGYMVDGHWCYRVYRGKNLPCATIHEVGQFNPKTSAIIYPEHDDKYLKECLLNLKSKGAELTNGKTIDEWLVELDLKGV